MMKKSANKVNEVQIEKLGIGVASVVSDANFGGYTMRYYQNTLTGEVVSEDEYSYAAAQKGNWVLYPKIPRYTIVTSPYSPGRAEFDEDGKLCYWDDVKDIVRELEELKIAVKAIKAEINRLDGIEVPK